jgi:DNA-binding GntR family transcriptional regulator
MSSLRVPPPSETVETSISLSDESILKYDREFAALLLDDMKADVMLRLFIIRMRYECEVVKTVAQMATKMDILELDEIVDNLNASNDLTLISKYDTEFHKRLFAIVGDVDFFTWWRSQSKTLNIYMNNFWKSVGYHTARYDVIIDIHNKILDAIKVHSPEDAIKQMERHFSFVVVELMGSLFESGS